MHTWGHDLCWRELGVLRRFEAPATVCWLGTTPVRRRTESGSE